MNCPGCGAKSRISRTLHSHENEIYRQRLCLECSNIFYTIEYEMEYTDTFKKEFNNLLRDNFIAREKVRRGIK